MPLNPDIHLEPGHLREGLADSKRKVKKNMCDLYLNQAICSAGEDLNGGHGKINSEFWMRHFHLLVED